MTLSRDVLDGDAERLSLTLFLRGILLAPIAGVGVRWPSAAVLAIVVAGGLVGTIGVVEFTIGVMEGTRPGYRGFFFWHGIMAFALGVLTACIPVASVENARLLTSIWLVANAALVAVIGMQRRRTFERAALLVWGTAHAAGAAALWIASPAPIETLVRWTAVYLLFLGVAQLGGAAWTRRWTHYARAFGTE